MFGHTSIGGCNSRDLLKEPCVDSPFGRNRTGFGENISTRVQARGIDKFPYPNVRHLTFNKFVL